MIAERVKGVFIKVSPNSILTFLTESILIFEAFFLIDYDWPRGQCFAQYFL